MDGIKTPDEEALFLENQGLVWSIARRFFGRGVEADDLFQIGCVGLIKAIRGYDESFGTAFSTYAVPKILGEILRYFRDDGMIKVPRPKKRDALRILNAKNEFEEKNGRSPRLSELSKLTGIMPEEIAAAENALLPVRSLEEQTGEDEMSLERKLGVSEEESVVTRISLYDAIKTLKKEEQMVISLRFFKGLTQEQTARILNTSQVQVSRIQKRALARLRLRIFG